MDFVIEHSYLIPLLPLVGAMIAGFFGARWLRGQSHWPIWLGVGASAVLSVMLLLGMSGRLGHDEAGGPGAAAANTASPQTQAATTQVREATAQPEPMEGVIEGADRHAGTRHTADVRGAMGASFGQPHILYRWIHAGDFRADAGFWFDPLTAVMLCVVCGIGFFITVFAAGYMKGEAGYFRFFAYLGLFIFMMTNLVMGENLIMLYLGWEGVGLCSYLLIGYYYDKPAAREAAKKAFLVNRVGDFGFGVGIMLTYYCFGTVSYFGDPANGVNGFMQVAADMAAAGISEEKRALATWIPFCLMLGAFGKSAQFPLYVWLPDAMEGPTPVSALIHAATMVTAGVYMIARCSVLFALNEQALIAVAFVGAFTALFAGSIALRQFDLKKVFAYSTVSQLGFMFVGVGILAPVAGVFHLVTHAFFKALLFLGSGVVMHAMLGHLDMRKMSGLKTELPKTRILILIGCLALAGFPLTSGFFSKDEIIASAGHTHWLLHAVLLLTALLTAYYTFRLYFRVFEGPTLVPTEAADGHHGADDHGAAHGHADHGHGTGTTSMTSAGSPAHGGAREYDSAAPSASHGHADDAGHGARAYVALEAAHQEHSHASTPAVQTGTAGESGVDQHLATKAHQDATAHGHGGHGHGHGHGDHNHEPMVMILPLVVLAIGALGAGLLLGPTHILAHFLGDSPSFRLGYEAAAARFGASEELKANFGLAEVSHGWGPLIIGSLVAFAGIGLAYFFHLKERARGEQLARSFGFLTRPMEAKYWVDEVYQYAVVEPLRLLGRLLFTIDRFVIDGLVWAIGFVPQLSGWALKLTVQRGYLQGYAVAMLFGLAAMLLLVFL